MTDKCNVDCSGRRQRWDDCHHFREPDWTRSPEHLNLDDLSAGICFHQSTSDSHAGWVLMLSTTWCQPGLVSMSLCPKTWLHQIIQQSANMCQMHVHNKRRYENCGTCGMFSFTVFAFSNKNCSFGSESDQRCKLFFYCNCDWRAVEKSSKSKQTSWVYAQMKTATTVQIANIKVWQNKISTLLPYLRSLERPWQQHGSRMPWTIGSMPCRHDMGKRHYTKDLLWRFRNCMR